MKKINEMIAVMQAFKDGKEIEICDKNKWEKCGKPVWNWMDYDYRVKPEPKYVPYDSVSEVEKNKWVRNKVSPSKLRAIIMTDTMQNAVYIARHGWTTLEEFFRIFEYEDGTPCGKLVSE